MSFPLLEYKINNERTFLNIFSFFSSINWNKRVDRTHLSGVSSKRSFVYSTMTRLLVHPLNPTYKPSISIAIEEVNLQYIVSSNLLIVD